MSDINSKYPTYQFAPYVKVDTSKLPLRSLEYYQIDLFIEWLRSPECSRWASALLGHNGAKRLTSALIDVVKSFGRYTSNIMISHDEMKVRRRLVDCFLAFQMDDGVLQCYRSFDAPGEWKLCPYSYWEYLEQKEILVDNG